MRVQISEKRNGVGIDRPAERSQKPQPEQDFEIGRNAEFLEPIGDLAGIAVPLFVFHAVILHGFAAAVNKCGRKGHCETEKNVLYCIL